jgi:hypothetical protein
MSTRPLLLLFPKEFHPRIVECKIHLINPSQQQNDHTITENELCQYLHEQLLINENFSNDFDSVPLLRVAKTKYTDRVETFDLLVDNDIITLDWNYQNGLLGGKGGFGAGLRAMGKTAAAKQKPSNDFSLCRDLSGNRLGIINTTLLLEKAKELHATGSGTTSGAAAGVGEVEKDEWLLEKPTWVEGASSDNKKDDKKSKWHVSKKAKTPQAQDSATASKMNKAGMFQVQFSSHLEETSEDTVSAVAEGLSRKRSRMVQNSSSSANQNEDKSIGIKQLSTPEEVIIVSGNANVAQYDDMEYSIFRITGVSEFCTLSFPKHTNNTFEGKLLTDGLIQVGFANVHCIDAGMESNLDGVGDVPGSYGFDLTRRMIWANGQATAFPSQVTLPSGSLATIKCSYDPVDGVIEFRIPGSEGFTVTVDEENRTALNPTISLEKGEEAEIRLAIKKVTTATKDSDPLEDKQLSLQSLEALGADKLKEELKKLGLKFGGTIQERAKRLLIAKTLSREEWPSSIFPL